MHPPGTYRPHASMAPARTTAEAYASGRAAVDALGLHHDLTSWQARWIGERVAADPGWRPERARLVRAYYLGVARSLPAALPGTGLDCPSHVPTPHDARSRVRRRAA